MDTLEHTTIATTMIAGDIIGTATMAADGTTITVSAGSRNFGRQFGDSPGVDR